MKPSGIIDSGASITFVTMAKKISNPKIHKSELQTAEENSSFTSHSGKTILTLPDNEIYVPALVAPHFKEGIICVAQLAKRNNVVFIKDYCYLIGTSPLPTQAAIIGKKTENNLISFKKATTTSH